VLGRKKHYVKDSDPLAPTYIMSTKSNRKVVIGYIDNNKPKTLIKRDINKDTKRYLRVDDITGQR
jgi:hypothetical protein